MAPIEPARLEQTVAWFLSGATAYQVAEAIRATWPDQEPAELINHAVTYFAAQAECPADIVRGWCYEAYRDLYRRMVEIGDFAGAVRAVKLIHDMAARG